MEGPARPAGVSGDARPEEGVSSNRALGSKTVSFYWERTVKYVFRLNSIV